jgi:hypothetical protein
MKILCWLPNFTTFYTGESVQWKTPMQQSNGKFCQFQKILLKEVPRSTSETDLLETFLSTNKQ